MDYTKEIDTMRHNLVHIRKVCGMSATEFGGLIGVTRQTINNIEYGRNKLTQAMYLAILYVMEKRIYPTCSAAQREMLDRLLVDKVTECNYHESLSFD